MGRKQIMTDETIRSRFVVNIGEIESQVASFVGNVSSLTEWTAKSIADICRAHETERVSDIKMSITIDATMLEILVRSVLGDDVPSETKEPFRPYRYTRIKVGELQADIVLENLDAKNLQIRCDCAITFKNWQAQDTKTITAYLTGIPRHMVEEYEHIE